jgi:hypothetical protein
MTILEYDEPPEAAEPWCKCGLPDMPGTCPGWRNCPMCDQEEELEQE